MKKTYIIPAVTTYNVRVHKMMALSLQGVAEDKDSALSDDNSLDDQETPWYRK